MKNVKKYVLNQLDKQLISQQEAVLLLKELQQKDTQTINDVAIIGASCRVPMANNTEEYWDNLVNGRNCFVTKPVDKLLFEKVFYNPHYAEFFECNTFQEENENVENYIGAFIEDFDKFDAGFFNIPPREAKYIDPQQRVFLESAWSAIEDAGYSVSNIKNTSTGVYVGRDGTNSINYKYITEEDPMKISGTWEGILASRINYIFNFKGPAMVIDTACSSGLVAIHEACNALRNEECEMAVAGGIAINASGFTNEDDEQEDKSGANNSDGDGAMSTVTSNDNRVRSFDKKASGTVFGEGCVVFLLKPLEAAKRDKDHIYGVIKGSAINSDGASNGLTAPNPIAQEAVIIDAWKRAKVSPESISYVETHGTGTLLGDPIEVLGLTNAFAKFTDKKQFCGIGSVKTNIGHIVGAAGCANLLKVVLSMQNNVLPPSLNFEEPNPHINFLDSPLYVVDKLTEWKRTEEHPLRAGISAFGFSGTNCHLIVEESDTVLNKKVDTNKNNVFTLSGKTETSILNNVMNYNKFLQHNTKMNMADICFTANTGRGHYGYRLALIVNSFEDFINKISILSKNGLKTIEEEKIFYGKNHVVSDKRQQKAEGEITESELRQINNESQELIAVLKENKISDDYEDQLQNMCKLYVKGASIEWNQLYVNEDVSRVSLPTYAFDKTHYFGDIKVTKIKGDALDPKKSTHPLVEKCLVESMYQSIYLVNFNLQKHWVIQEHKILGSHIVSGTTYIEICKEAFRQYFRSDNILFKSIVFLAPLVVTQEDDDVETHIIITKEENDSTFIVVSKHLDANDEVVWTEHVKGTACLHEEAAPKQVDFNTIKNIEDKEVIKLITLEEGEGEFTGFGPRWRCVENTYRVIEDGYEVIYCELKLPDKFIKDMKEYNYHPGMLDDAINMATFQIYAGSDVYLPFTYKNMTIFKNIPSHFYSKLRKIGNNADSEIMKFNVILADMEGNTIALIDECTAKRVSKFNSYFTSSFYGLQWANQEEEERENKIPEGNILVFKDLSGLADQFVEKIQTDQNYLYFISWGDQYEKVDDTHFILSGNEEDYEKLIADAGVQSFSTVYHMGSINFNQKDSDYKQVQDEMKHGLYSLVYLTKAFMKKISGKVDFILLTENAYEINGNEEYIKPSNASFIALAKTLVQECPGYTYRCVDIDALTETNRIFNEILRSDEHEFRVGYRKDTRYTEVLNMVDIPRGDIDDVKINKDGVYIITGGTGGLGLETALNFGDIGQCNICLIGRRKLPERAQWTEILKKDESRKECNLIRGILQLEGKGCQVLMRYADVCDLEEMRKITDEMKKEFGKINGIVHCAGVAGDGFLYKKTMDVFNNVINPKVYGTVILDELTKDQELEFFIMFSSMQTLFGGPGQGDYTSANTFLDSYAPYLRRMGVKAIAINWPGWSETGMAVDYNVADSVTMFNSLTTQTAIQAFNNIIKYELSNLVPGEMNFEFISQIGAENLPFKLSDKLSRDLQRFQSRNNASGRDRETNVFNPDELSIIGKSDEEYTETEKVVAYIYAAVLNMNEIDIYESFSSMGGDSIISIEVLKVLNQQFNGILNVSDMFTYPCIEEMSAYIDSQFVVEEVAVTDTYDDIMNKFETGDVDIDSMIEYFEEAVQ